MLRAFIVGSLVYAVAVAFTGVHLAHVGWTLLFAVAVSASFALLGILAAMWAEKFDHLSIVPNFVLTPLTFLGGVFYSIDMLPAPWDTISRLNPILYMVNGLRYGLLGISDVDVLWSATSLCALLTVLAIVTWYAVESGYNIRD